MKELFMLNKEDIYVVCFVGFKDGEEFEFRKYINEQIEKITVNQVRYAA